MTMRMVFPFLILCVSYSVGSVPFGLLFARFFAGVDPRQSGSGNIGATNVLRVGSKFSALLTLLCDFLKGFLPLFFFLHYFERFSFLRDAWPTKGVAIFAIALATVCGHIFPIWLKGKGGKGVASTFGVFGALNPWAFLFGVSLWLGCFLFTKISSLSALISLCFATPLFFAYSSVQGGGAVSSFFLALTLALILLGTHRKNIQRLWKGQETPFFKET
jgi:glycerol-3-phosphate acyltransferase PlsY